MFFKTHHDSQRGLMLNNYPVKMSGGTKVEINDNNNNITPGLQKIFTDTTYDVAKLMNDTEQLVFRDIFRKTGYFNRKPTKGRLSGQDRYFKSDPDDDVIKSLKLDTKRKCRGVEEIIIPSNIIDIYTRLEILLGLKLSGHTDTLTEASNLIDRLYKRGEIQIEQQYRKPLKKYKR